MNKRTQGKWTHEDPTIRRKTRRTAGVIAALSLITGSAGAAIGLDAALGGGTDTGITPTDNPNPAYTGPSDHCLPIYDHAVEQAHIAGGSISQSDATTLIDCTDNSPGYFMQQTVPVATPDGNIKHITVGDRPAH